MKKEVNLCHQWLQSCERRNLSFLEHFSCTHNFFLPRWIFFWLGLFHQFFMEISNIALIKCANYFRTAQIVSIISYQFWRFFDHFQVGNISHMGNIRISHTGNISHIGNYFPDGQCGSDWPTVESNTWNFFTTLWRLSLPHSTLWV